MYKLFSALLSRLTGPWRPKVTARLEQLDVVLYTRRDCHLCDVAWERLRQARESYHFKVAVVDVDGNRELAARYGNEVPVVTINGKVRFRGVVNELLLKRLLRAEADRLATANARSSG